MNNIKNENTDVDFTEARYNEILTIAAKKYRFLGSDISGDDPIVCWRHDVDYSPHRALALAKIEAEKGLKCVYHILCSSRYYNILESEISNILREIAILGHEIGLHFDMDVFNDNSITKKEILDRIAFEKDVLEYIIQENLVSFSFHNHTLHQTDIVETLDICGMKNLASPEFYKPTKYLSDSNGFWRFEDLKTLVDGPTYNKLHILTHPVWWTPEDMSPLQRVYRTVEGRAKSNKNIYIQTMARDGRLEIIGKKIGVTNEVMQNAGFPVFKEK